MIEEKSEARSDASCSSSELERSNKETCVVARPASTNSSDELLSIRITSPEDSPPIRTRSLNDIYRSCTFALHVADHVDIIEVVKNI